MSKKLLCDICGKPTDKFVAKLFISPTSKRGDYTGHADVGECCTDQIIKKISWRKRIAKV